MTNEELDKQIEHGILEKVKQYGWQVSIFASDGYNPGFAYTIGLVKTFQHPELFISGLSTDHMGELLNIAGDFIKGGGKIQLGSPYREFLENYDCQFIKVHHKYYSDYLGYCQWFNQGNDFDIYQLVWPNKQGNYPWNKGEDEDFHFRQPLLDRKVDFKYLEPDNLGTFTTKYVMQQKKPILEVYHDIEGVWQFLCGTTQNPKDYKIIGLKEIVQIDHSVNELFNLGLGEVAWRKSPGESWNREKIQHQRYSSSQGKLL